MQPMRAWLNAPATDDAITFVLACIGAWTVGKWIAQEINVRRFRKILDQTEGIDWR